MTRKKVKIEQKSFFNFTEYTPDKSAVNIHVMSEYEENGVLKSDEYGVFLDSKYIDNTGSVTPAGVTFLKFRYDKFLEYCQKNDKKIFAKSGGEN